MEERRDARLTEIEVDEDDELAGTGKRDREVACRGRLPFTLHRARDHERLQRLIGAREFDVRREPAHGVCLSACGRAEHRQMTKPARRLRHPRKKRKAELPLDLGLGADALVERLEKERGAAAEQETEAEPEQSVPLRCRLDLVPGALRAEDAVLRLKQLHGVQLLLAADDGPIEDGGAVAVRAQLGEPCVELVSRSLQ